MTTLMLVRHGSTDWNVEEIYKGHADVDLNETGIKQAELLARHLEYLPIEAIYSSPLKRALETAEMIARYHNVDVTPCQELIDFDYGPWTGLSHETVRQKFQAMYDEWVKNPHLAKFTRGDSLTHVRQRALEVVNRVVSKHQAGVVLVSHRVIHKVIICALLGLSNSLFWNVRLDICGVTTFAYEDGQYVLTMHNDTSFLKPLGETSASDF